jgi:hypothetical protein
MSTFETQAEPAFLASITLRRLLSWLLWLLLELLFGKANGKWEGEPEAEPMPWADEIMFRSEAGAF